MCLEADLSCPCKKLYDHYWNIFLKLSGVSIHFGPIWPAQTWRLFIRFKSDELFNQCNQG